MSTVKDRNGRDLTEAEDIKKRWQEYRRTIQKKITIMVITHLEPDILEWDVKWALGSLTTYKASGGDGISVKLIPILKDDAVEVLRSVCQQIWKSHQWLQYQKRSVFIPILKKGNAYHTIALISHTSKVTNAHKSPSQASIVHEQWTSRCSSCI